MWIRLSHSFEFVGQHRRDSRFVRPDLMEKNNDNTILYLILFDDIIRFFDRLHVGRHPGLGDLLPTLFCSQRPRRRQHLQCFKF